MATYVVSDVHSSYIPLRRLLEKVKFNEEDTLIINGDIFDRRPVTKEYIDFLLNSNNIEMILGNHDYMYTRVYEEILVNGLDEEDQQVLNPSDDFMRDHKYYYIGRQNGVVDTYYVMKSLEEKYNVEYTKIFYEKFIKLPLYIIKDDYLISHTCSIAGLLNKECTLTKDIIVRELDKGDVWEVVFDRSFHKFRHWMNLTNLDINIIYGHTTIKYIPCQIDKRSNKLIININHTSRQKMSLFCLDDRKLYEYEGMNFKQGENEVIRIYDKINTYQINNNSYFLLYEETFEYGEYKREES